MKQFISFIKKEFLHIFRDRRTMLILLGMPIVQILLFGFALTTEVKNSKIAVLDPSKDEVTRAILQRLESSGYFDISEYLNTPAEIDKAFQGGNIDMIVSFSPDFGNQLHHEGTAQLQLIADASDPNTAQTLVGYANNIVLQYQQEQMENMQIPFVIHPDVKMLYNPQLKGAYNFVPGVMGLVLMLICAMMTSISIVREKEIGTMEVLLVSPMRPIFIILAKVVPYFVLSCVNVATILLLAVFVLDVPIAGSLIALLFASLIFILVALALGLMISNFAQNQITAMLFSGMVLMMPTMILSGMIFPIESMPLILQWFSHIVPARWYISAVKKIMIQGVPILYASKELLIMLGMIAVLLMASLKKFKVRL